MPRAYPGGPLRPTTCTTLRSDVWRRAAAGGEVVGTDGRIYAQPNLMPWVEALRQDVDDLRPFDAHVHLGLRDPAGLLATEEEALDALEQVGSRALIFPLKEPGGYTVPNTRMLELVEAHPERLKALCRLDPADGPAEEARRCLDAGAVGFKRHPRGEGFGLTDARLD